MTLKQMETQLADLQAQRTALVHKLSETHDQTEQEVIEDQILDLYYQIIDLQDRITDLDYPDILVLDDSFLEDQAEPLDESFISNLQGEIRSIMDRIIKR